VQGTPAVVRAAGVFRSRRVAAFAGQFVVSENVGPYLLSVAQRSQLQTFSPAALRLLQRRPRLQRFLQTPPALTALERAPVVDEEFAKRLLRLLRQRVFVHTAAQESGVCADPEKNADLVLDQAALWAAFADAAVRYADRVAHHQLCQRFVPPQQDGAAIGRVVFALGKWGSSELNASSDIDILFAYGTDDADLDVADDVAKGRKVPDSAHIFFTKWAQKVRSILHDVTDEGFVFRVDLDLRPEGTRGALVNSVDALEGYYESFGLTWERAALTRLRPVVDDDLLGSVLMRRLRPFVYPRSVNLNVFAQLDDMRDRIEVSAKAHLPDLDVKRSRGGIRDVEFLLHCYQLALGGQKPQLRHGSVDELCSLLESLGHLSFDESQILRDGYRFLRRVEHALQYAEDQQTQRVPTEGERRRRLAKALFPFVDDDDVERQLDEAYAAHTDNIRDIYEQHLRRKEPTSQEGAAAFEHVELNPYAVRALSRQADDATRQGALTSLGFAHADRALAQLQQLAKRPYSPFSPYAQAKLPSATRLALALLTEVSSTVDPDATLGRLYDVFASPVHSALVERLAHAPRLVRVMVRVLGVSAPLSRMLGQRSGMEATLFNGIRRDRLPKSRLMASLRENVGDDDELALSRMRKVQGRVLLSEGMALFAGLHGVVQTGHHLSVVADALLQRAYEVAWQRVARRHGQPLDVRFAVFALGSLGGREFGFFRDLDLLFVYDGDADSDGRRSVSSSQWSAKLAQQLMWALSVPLPEGRCYEVDARLRPSGNQGPLVVKQGAFARYHQGESAIWERQSMLRMRPVAGDRSLATQVMADVQPLLHAPEDDLGQQLLDMRTRMVDERGGRGGLNLKMGQGGLADVEFVAQGFLLRHQAQHPGLWAPSTRRSLKRLAKAGLLSTADAMFLREHYDVLTAVREVAVLVENTHLGLIAADDVRWPRMLQSRLLEGLIDSRSPKAAFASLQEKMQSIHDVTQRLLTSLR